MQKMILKSATSLSLILLLSTQLWSHGGEKHEKKEPAKKMSKTKESITKNHAKIKVIEDTVAPDTTKQLSKKLSTPVSSKEEIMQKTYQTINTTYLADIKPIFEKKCFDCHGTLKEKPWYYDIPGISYMIQKDMEESKEHMDMRKDFPFVSHESPYNDLKSIKEIGLNGGMPPLQYILGHWDSILTDDERKKLVTWSEKSMQDIEEKGINTQAESSH